MDDKLALFGGKPVRIANLPYGRQSINDADIAAVINVLKSDYLTTGPKVEAFEKALAEYCGVKHAAVLSNGTAALHAAVSALGLGENDEVIVPACTFAASSNCALYQGARVRFSDICPNTLTTNIKFIRKVYSKGRTKAIITVDFAGICVDMDPIMQFAKEEGVAVISDAAHSFGSEYKGVKTGSLADMTIFSFHPLKNICSGEGGAVMTNDTALYRKIVLFRTHGITKNPDQFIRKSEGGWHYEMQCLGYNYRLSDIHCALGLSQLNRIAVLFPRRKLIVEKYDEELSKYPFPHWFTIQKEPYYSKAVRHLYPIQIRLEVFREEKKTFFEAIRAENIGVNSMYVPVYKHPYYNDNLEFRLAKCPNAESFFDRCLVLPLFSAMTISDCEDVIAALRKVCGHFFSNSSSLKAV